MPPKSLSFHDAQWEKNDSMVKTQQEEMDAPSLDFLDGKLPDGWHTINYSSGNVFEGDVVDQMMHGKGTYTYAGGAKEYVGEFSQHSFHGKGSMSDKAAKTSYEGEWENNKKHGQGVNQMANGDKFDGTFTENQLTKGKYTYADGRWYDGEFQKGIKHGQGTLKQANGDLCEGTFEEGKMTGNAVINYASQKKFEGRVINRKKVKGKLTFLDGSSYNGDFVEDKPDGVGERKFKDGDLYKGEWREGQMEGTGRMDMAPGKKYASYQGAWKAGKFHGVGTVVTSTGVRLEADWMAGTTTKQFPKSQISPLGSPRASATPAQPEATNNSSAGAPETDAPASSTTATTLQDTTVTATAVVMTTAWVEDNAKSLVHLCELNTESKLKAMERLTAFFKENAPKDDIDMVPKLMQFHSTEDDMMHDLRKKYKKEGHVSGATTGTSAVKSPPTSPALAPTKQPVAAPVAQGKSPVTTAAVVVVVKTSPLPLSELRGEGKQKAEERLRAFYEQHAPEKADNVAKLMQFHISEDAMMQDLRNKYKAVQPSPTDGTTTSSKQPVLGSVSTSSPSSSVALCDLKGDEKTKAEERLTAFYKKHEPSALDKVPKLMQFHISEDAMMQDLRKKYKAVQPSPSANTATTPAPVKQQPAVNQPGGESSTSSPSSSVALCDLKGDEKTKAEERLTAFYKKYEPSALDKVPKLMQFHSTEVDIMQDLRKKYKV